MTYPVEQIQVNQTPITGSPVFPALSERLRIIKARDPDDPFDDPIYALLDASDVVKMDDLPTDHCYYLLAKNGSYRFNAAGAMVRGFTKVEAIPGLGLHGGGLMCSAQTKIARTILLKTLMFFKEIYKQHGAEAIVLLLYSAELKRFGMFVPRQTVGNMVIHKYEPGSCQPAPGTVLVGTIHSHGTSSSFHSSTDVNDEANQDGLHFTFGCVMSNPISISGCLVLNKFRQQVEASDYFDGLDTNLPTINHHIGFANTPNFTRQGDFHVIGTDPEWLELIGGKEKWETELKVYLERVTCNSYNTSYGSGYPGHGYGNNRHYNQNYSQAPATCPAPSSKVDQYDDDQEYHGFVNQPIMPVYSSSTSIHRKKRRHDR